MPGEKQKQRLDIVRNASHILKTFIVSKDALLHVIKPCVYMKEIDDFKECWDISKEHHEDGSSKVEYPERLKAFVLDLIDVYKKHGMGLSHEDQHGSFIADKLYPDHIRSLKEAFKGYKESEFDSYNETIRPGSIHDDWDFGD